MSTITLPNIRVSSDLTVSVRLKDNGVAIDWSTLNNVKASIYSDAQRALAGRCDVSVDAEDPTVLVCQYAANKPQYVGVCRIVVSAKYMGETKTYDKPAFNFVRWTADQDGEQITIDDPDVDVEIEVSDVSSSLLDEAIRAAFTAAEEAVDAKGQVLETEAEVEAAEALRVSAEESRVEAEEGRAEAEAARVDEEAVRVSAEHARVVAENARAAAEDLREGAEDDRAAAETARETAEAARVAAEALRVTAEGSRETAEAAREVQASADHTVAVGDHMQAAADHTQAAADHTTAASDHTQAGADHTLAAADHVTAGEDHAQAQDDHEVMAGYDTRLGNVEGEVSQLEAKVTDLDGTFDRVSIPGSDNLLDPSTIEEDCYYWQGTRNATSSYSATDFIPVNVGDVITLQNGNGGSGATLAANRVVSSMRFVDAYDADKHSVSSASQANTNAYTVPNGVAYIRISTSQFKPFGYFYPCVFANVSEIRDYEQYAPISYKLILKAENNNDEHINTLVDEKTLPIAEDVEELREDVNEILSGYGSETISGDDSILLNDVAPTSQNVLVSLETRNLNLLPYTCGDGSLNGITYQVRQDGSIALWGTATAHTQLDIRGNASKVSFPAGTYTISVRSNKPFGSNIRFFANGITGSFAYENTPRTATIANDVESTITLSIITPFSATQEDPVIVYLMVESGSEETDYQSPKTKDTWDLEPYFPTIALSVNHNGDITTASISSGAGNIPINADGGNLSISTPIPLVITATALVVKEEKNGLGIALSASVGVTPIIKRDANFSANDKISLLYTNTKKNKVLSFFGKISTFGELTINHGPGVYAGGVITIDATRIIVKVYYSGYTEYLNEAHGLTFSDYVGVIVSINEVGLLNVFIYTNGGSYTKDRVAWSGRGVVEIENTGNSSFTDVVATWNCNDFKKPVWVFGDSYIGYSDPARWPKYVVEWGNGNFLLSGFGGEGATDGITDFNEAINHGTPKAALWLLGMNNGDTGGEINSTWLTGVQSFISKCYELGIEPILATIPNTPSIEHTYKNAWVVASGCRYIDFASAVGASTYPSSWTTGMLSNDNVHPSQQGAITLAMAAASAVPELLQK